MAIGHPASAMIRATVQVLQETKYDGGSRTTKGSVIASFTDITTVEVKSRQPDHTVGGLACYGLTGAPTKTCRPGFSEPCNVEPVEVEAVTLEGLSGGVHQLSSTSAGKYSKEDLANPPFGQGEVKVKVTGRKEKGYFPTYEQALIPVEPIQLLEPDPTGGGSAGLADIRFRWNPGDIEKDAIILDISSADPSITDKIKCHVKDDGCHTLLSGALEWLDVKQGEAFRVSITRVRASVAKPDGQTSAQLTVVSEVETKLTR